MKYNIIGSSSKGNAIIIEDMLLLDCGVSYTKLKTYLKNIKLIFISHVHKDHLLTSTIKKIGYNYPTIKYLCGSEEVVKKIVECGVTKKNIYILKPSKWYDLGLFKAKLEPLEHDTPNYAIMFEYEDKKCVYIVDTANVNNIEAKDYDLYLIESNYKEDILQYHKDICEDEDEMFYLDRVPLTHLSYEQANDFLINNMGANSEYQYIHQSSYNFKEENDGNI